jgi:hypothetical protein
MVQGAFSTALFVTCSNWKNSKRNIHGKKLEADWDNGYLVHLLEYPDALSRFVLHCLRHCASLFQSRNETERPVWFGQLQRAPFGDFS